MEAILATDINFGISKDGKIPWKSKKYMSFFFKKTKNNVLIMGRTTYFSLPQEFRPLKDRLNIVLTNKPNEYLDCKEDTYNEAIFTNNDKIYHSILNYKEKYQQIFPYLSSNFKIFIIGGKQIYEKYIPLCSTVWVTTIKKNYSCNLFFDYDYNKQFKEELVEEDEELKIVKWKKNF